MINTTKNTRMLNGYRLIYKPNHQSSMKSSNWNGYVYEHIFIAEKHLGRSLIFNEVVHHLNGDRCCNNQDNLIVLERGQHVKLHKWIDKGAPRIEKSCENGENSGKSSNNFSSLSSYCTVCNTVLGKNSSTYCSIECRAFDNRKINRPNVDILLKDINSMPILQVGKKYGVSDNTIRKWMKSYNIQKTILSRAKDTSLEGAETSGEV